MKDADMAEMNATKKLLRSLPSESGGEGWLEQAKDLSPMMTYRCTASAGLQNPSCAK